MRFCDILEKEGFSPQDINIITEAVIACMSPKWTEVHRTMRDAFDERY